LGEQKNYDRQRKDFCVLVKAPINDYENLYCCAYVYGDLRALSREKKYERMRGQWYAVSCLATWIDGEVSTGQGFSGLWKPWNLDDEICIDGAHHH
jgi:hypothetical protein